MNKTAKEVLSKVENIYLNYFNSGMTYERFAEHYGVPEKLMETLIDFGREINHFDEFFN